MLQLLRVYYKNSKLYCEILPNITPKLDTNLKKKDQIYFILKLIQMMKLHLNKHIICLLKQHHSGLSKCVERSSNLYL